MVGRANPFNGVYMDVQNSDGASSLNKNCKDPLGGPNKRPCMDTTPAFGDIDGDGDEDLCVGDHVGHLHLYERTGTATVARVSA